jgi:fructose-1,6-bisphosphatase/inositol monophosphatase family enzyme
MTDIDLDGVRRLLCQLQDTVRDSLIAARDSQPAASLAEVAEVTAADTIYRIDKVSEEVILEWFGRSWPAGWSVELVMEGAEGGDAHTFPSGTPVERTSLVCILDPIDGTRNLMYDKRSAWMLAAVAPQRGRATCLDDILVAAMTELPTSALQSCMPASGKRTMSTKGLSAPSSTRRTCKSRCKSR